MHDASDTLAVLSTDDLANATGGHSPQALRTSGFRNQAAYNRHLHYSGLGEAFRAEPAWRHLLR